MRRVLIAAAAAVVLYGCQVNARQCVDQTDCFGGEVCRDNVCVAAPDSTEDTGGEDALLSDVDDNDTDEPTNCRGDENACGFRICNVSTGLCEDCQRDAQCDDGEFCDMNTGRCACRSGYHECGQTCRANDSPDSCGMRCEPCPPTEGGEATCEDGQCGIRCLPPLQRCEQNCPDDRVCVECEVNDDCTEYDASVCQAGECVPCETSSDCSHLDQTVCTDGRCVECAIGEAQACGDFSCNPATGECTTTLIGSLDWCEPCVADNECPPEARCIPMEYKGTRRAGGFCLEQADDGCSRIATIAVQRDSLSGIVGEHYCTIREDLTTCEALLDFGRPCDQDNQCGKDGSNDAKCRLINGTRQCTIPCVNSVECPAAHSCVGNPPTNSYCGEF